MAAYSEVVIDAFLKYGKDTDIARASGLSRHTIGKYKRDPALQEILRERRGEIFRSAVDRLRGSLAPIADELEKIALDQNVSPQVRINASSVIFSNALKMMEMIDVEQRLAALEGQRDQIEALMTRIQQMPGGAK